MKIAVLFRCSSCDPEGENGNLAMDQLEVPDSLIFESTCQADHPVATAIENDKYEIFFDLALVAFKRQAHVEAVSLAATAYERLFETYIWASLGTRRVSDAAAVSTWKLVRNSSERQYGVFCSLWLLDTSTSAPDLNAGQHRKLGGRSVVAYRNRVVHAGHLATRSEAREFLRQVYALARHVQTAAAFLRQPPKTDGVTPGLRRRLANASNLDLPHTVLRVPTALDPRSPGAMSTTFEETMDRLDRVDAPFIAWAMKYQQVTISSLVPVVPRNLLSGGPD